MATYPPVRATPASPLLLLLLAFGCGGGEALKEKRPREEGVDPAMLSQGVLILLLFINGLFSQVNFGALQFQ